jgi:AraC-like DNA-binding protein
MLLSASAEFVGSVCVQPLTVMLLERINDAAFLVDPHGNFTYGNPSAHKLLDCSTAELLTMTVPDLPLMSLSQVWGTQYFGSQLGTALCFADQYITSSDDEVAVEVTVSYDQGIEKECSCLLIRPVQPDVVKPASILPNIPQLEPVFRFIEENYDRSISLKDVALATGYCPSYLTDLVRRCSGHTVNHWIIKRRISLACDLLQDTSNTVNQIAEAIGYQNEGHFFRQFRQHCGMTPLAWRKSQQSVG